MEGTELTVELLTSWEIGSDGEIQGTDNITERAGNIFELNLRLLVVVFVSSELLQCVDRFVVTKSEWSTNS